MKSETGKKKNKIILWNKQIDETSFQSLGKIKKLLGTRKVGHTGTLDKFASGLMIVLSGKLTRLNTLFSSMDKSYIAEISFGQETDTLDPSGEVIGEGPVPKEELVLERVKDFLGTQEQIPPLYSAIHVDGKRAWKRALAGEDVQMKSRTITIEKLVVHGWNDGILVLEVHCSKGTYIRSLARDIGLACESRAHLTGLKRISVGPFKLDESDESQEIQTMEAWELADYLPDFYRIQVEDTEAPLIRQGRELAFLFPQSPFNRNGHYGLFDKDKDLLAVVKSQNGKDSYLFVVPE